MIVAPGLAEDCRRLSDLMIGQFLSQGISIDTKQSCSPALIVRAMFHRNFNQGFFYLLNNHVIKVVHFFTIQIIQKSVHSLTDAFFDGVISFHWFGFDMLVRPVRG